MVVLLVVVVSVSVVVEGYEWWYCCEGVLLSWGKWVCDQ